MVLVMGIDDAGRGPIIGPMILAGVLIDEKCEISLKKLGVKDSKQLAHPKRIELSREIKKSCASYHITKTFPEQIDLALSQGTNLNTLEAMKTAEIINALNSEKQKIKVIVDCPSVNTKAWQLTLSKYIKHPSNLALACEHKADVNYVSVSAASVIAKVVREEEVEKLREQYKKYGDIGSGYPADPLTKEFLKKRGRELENSGLFRKSWMTWKRLFPDLKKQSTLEKF
jgi:ribonuclease HII